ncbi:restriction endonuclease subunit S [Acinetobacter baumannii]|uniref:restriction endonuclease subunit S n=1 Tax=Acinetobacter baumannii TaxID=470 RepID=UPI000DE764B1|nr:restriction endonuclease subunit S [Acinetobacter baumannii]MCJ8917445.1 restriction endonuclease subunit S [Acinetobacter baumannii]MCJ9203802.1 restriction endonuclease subunit S [Acinetobacter baumannii]MDC4455513.1 restriction endonuclease subunit S [Acinetobacter baumannii]MDC5119965.1 restriction endonuclease subunit S [Acinetobacter baumannii]MDO7449110.1 restriction endonuclease subunit S [Acinetobacter baumannii]
MAAPKLRFKEFDGDWTFKNLSDVSSKPLYGMNSAATDFDGENKYLRITDIDEESHRFKFTKLSSPSDVIEEKYILQEGDLLFARTGASVGKSYIYDPDDGKVVFAGFLIKFGLKESVIPYFIFTQTLSEKFNNWVITNSMRSGQPGINAEEYSKWQIAFTSKPEQIKIASFLSAVDEKISQLTQKHQLLSQYKQGMMQKLFSQQIRFKADDGSEFGEWKKVKFSDKFKFHQTNSYSRALLSEQGEIMNIHYGDIHTKFSTLFDISKEVVPFLSSEVNTNKFAEDQFLQVGDLVIADASEDYKDIGKALEIIHLNNQKVVAGLHTYIARPVQPFALGFCGYLMQTFEVREQIKKLATGISVLGISKTNIGKVEIKVPCLEEQTKIANFLSAIDQKIEVVAQQIEQAKQWKKGLLQQMFV